MELIAIVAGPVACWVATYISVTLFHLLFAPQSYVTTFPTSGRAATVVTFTYLAIGLLTKLI